VEAEKKFECNIHVLVKEKDSEIDNYFGHGVAKLLYGIKEYHSLRVSAKQMRMAYSKAWRIIREAEEGLGIQLLSRMGKKGSEITREGMLFLKAYEEIERETKKVAQRIFRKYYMEEKKNQEILREKEKS
jgi:molybdate transport system regulatory protein